MTIQPIRGEFSVCKIENAQSVPWDAPFLFAGKTDEELSLVCPTAFVPNVTSAREDGWRAFRIAGVLDFSLVGILSRVSSLLAAAKIGIFAVSTYNTDYVLVKKADFDNALSALRSGGYDVEEEKRNE